MNQNSYWAHGNRLKETMNVVQEYRLKTLSVEKTLALEIIPLQPYWHTKFGGKSITYAVVLSSTLNMF